MAASQLARAEPASARVNVDSTLAGPLSSQPLGADGSNTGTPELAQSSNQVTMLRIGTLNAHGFTSEEVDFLSLLGFTLRPGVSTYAGAQRMRFIDFAEPPSLEFVDVEDQAEYAAFVPEGMTPYCPGISIVAHSGSSIALRDFESAFSEWRPYRIHVGYTGGSDIHNRGRNYLNFATPIVAGTFIYLTEHEDPRPKPLSPPAHPNTASMVTGLVFDLPMAKLSALSTLTSQPASPDKFSIGSVTVYDASHVPHETKTRGKAFPLVGVIVRLASLTMLATSLQPRCQPSRWFGQDAVSVQMNSLSWDLVLTG